MSERERERNQSFLYHPTSHLSRSAQLLHVGKNLVSDRESLEEQGIQRWPTVEGLFAGKQKGCSRYYVCARQSARRVRSKLDGDELKLESLPDALAAWSVRVWSGNIERAVYNVRYSTVGNR